jgi:multiple sugar transport system permease protein
MTTVIHQPAALGAPPDPGPRQDGRRFRVTSLGWLSPSAVLLAVLFAYPVGYAVYIGLTNLQLIGPNAQSYQFTGLSNFRRMFHDPTFWKSTKLTLIFVVGSGIVAQTILGMALALLMRRSLAGVRISVSVVVVVAWIIPEISAAFVWYAFGTGGGTLSRLLGHARTDYLTTAPMLIVCVANAWRNTAFSMLVFSAGLRNVPSEVEEAAELEGAGYWRRLVSVVLPIMRPTIITNLLLLTLGNLSDFTLIFAMTQGGPGTNTAILPVYMYIQAFQFNELGYGTAIALALIVLGALMSLLYVRQLKPEVAR